MLLGQHRLKDSTVTDAEIHALIAEAESEGVLEPEERTMIAGVMRLGDRLVRTIMTPAADVEMIDIDQTPARIGKQMAGSGHSRFIAYEKSRENIIGVLQAKDVAAALLRRRAPHMRKLVKQAPALPKPSMLLIRESLKVGCAFRLVYDGMQVRRRGTTTEFSKPSWACFATTIQNRA